MNRYTIERHDYIRYRWLPVRKLLLPALLLALPILLIWREVRQQELNQALIAAVQHNDTHTVVALLDEGASANTRTSPPQLSWWRALSNRLRGQSSASQPGIPVLVLALGQQVSGTREHPEVSYHLTQNQEMVKALVAHGARVNEASPFGGWTPLMLAARSDQRDVMQFLLDHHADPNLKNREGHTAMDLAPHVHGKPDRNWQKRETLQLPKKAGGQ
jgi:hypothetical protein